MKILKNREEYLQFDPYEEEEITKDIEQLRLYYENELIEDLNNINNPFYKLKVMLRV